MTLSGLEGFNIAKSFERDVLYRLHIELERQPHCCTDYGKENWIHDYLFTSCPGSAILKRESHFFRHWYNFYLLDVL